MTSTPLTFAIDAIDLHNGALSRIQPEFPMSVHAVLPGGGFACISDSLKELILLNPRGQIVSRHRLRGLLHGLVMQGEDIYALELRGLTGHEFFSQQTAAQAELIVWTIVQNKA